MRPFRSRLLLRLVATLVVVGVGATLAPAAVARDARQDALRTLLGDVEAFETALDAARMAGDAVFARDAFVEAYVASADGDVAPEAIYDLLDGDALGLVAPVLPDEAFVPTPPAAPSPHGGSAAVVAPTAEAVLVASSHAVWQGEAAPPHRAEGRSLQPRAP